MNKKIFFLLAFFIAIARASINDLDTTFDTGLYSLTQRQIRSESSPYSIRQEVLLLAMGDFSPYQRSTSDSSRETSDQHEEGFHSHETQDAQTTAAYINRIVGEANPTGLIIKALWHVNKPLFEEEGPTFPRKYDNLFQDTRDSKIGITILTRLAPTNKHAAYMLSCIFLRPEIDDIDTRAKGNLYLRISAQLEHMDAQNRLLGLGIDWHDEDQFGDHCRIWLCLPYCSSNGSVWDNIRSCIGCGPDKSNHGWVECNLALCGCSTGLNSTSIAEYFTRGCMNCLAASALPIRLSTTVLTGATTILQAAGSSATLPVSVAATGCATLSAFIREETSPRSSASKTIRRQPTS